MIGRRPDRRTRFASYTGHSAALVAVAALLVLVAIQAMPR